MPYSLRQFACVLSVELADQTYRYATVTADKRNVHNLKLNLKFVSQTKSIPKNTHSIEVIGVPNTKYVSSTHCQLSSKQIQQITDHDQATNSPLSH